MEFIVKLIILILFMLLAGLLYVALKGQGEGFLDKLLNLFNMATVSRIISYIIPLVLLVLVGVIFLSDTGAWGDMKEAVLSVGDVLSDFLPKFSIGLEEQKAEVSIPDEHQQKIIKLTETISSMLY